MTGDGALEASPDAAGADASADAGVSALAEATAAADADGAELVVVLLHAATTMTRIPSRAANRHGLACMPSLLRR
jgi:hypothetical protein